MSVAKRDKLLESIAAAIADYRDGEIATPTPKHVDRWVKQFDADVQVGILAEMDHVVQQAYITRAKVGKFLLGIVHNKELAGDDTCTYWKSATILRLQTQGASQGEMLTLFDAALKKKCGFESGKNGDAKGPFIYIDDGIYTGMRVINDLKGWIQASAPKKCHVHVIVIALHSGGRRYADDTLSGYAAQAGKAVKFTWWRIVELESLPWNRDESDVLWPTEIPDEPLVQAYAKMLKDAGHPPELRAPGNVGKAGLFSSDEGRQLLEQEFLKAGALIRKQCPHLKPYHRPLGNIVLHTLGFGAVIVTFRNCPNNCPLAWWAGDPWYPLFPRKTN